MISTHPPIDVIHSSVLGAVVADSAWISSCAAASGAKKKIMNILE
eukprot:SAG31_NODE_35805_length_319_cov_1.390909_1_plen_44_part_10